MRLGALAAIAVLGFAACGDDDASTDTAGGASVPLSAGAATTTADTASPDTTVAGSDTTAAAPVSGDGSSPATDAAATTAGGEAPAGASTLALAETDLGTILVDGEGMTLYLFMPDAQGPSTCEADCLAAWPSFEGPATPGEGVDEALVATAARPDDGTEQVTYDGWPLYYFAQDQAPGDTTGQGIGEVWYVVGADGAPISET